MKYDILVIGMGPAGMSLSAMGSTMGLKVLAIEKKKVGGECLNCGCIPSKALLKSASIRHSMNHLKKYALKGIDRLPETEKPFDRIQNHLTFINEKKTMKMFDKVDLKYGSAKFIDKETVEVNGEQYKARKTYICTGTRPFIPPIKGIENVDILTNENIFNLEDIPKSMFIIGGGAIGTEMAQAFSRLGSKITLAHMDDHLIPLGDKEGAELLEEHLGKEGIEIYNSTTIDEIQKDGDNIKITTNRGEFVVEKLLVAAGRKANIDNLGLENAGVKSNRKGIITDKYGRTNIKNIWAIGDINGKALFSHAAMHQGMLSLMSSMMPFKQSFDKYHVPWSVFTDPEFAQVGFTEKELKDKGIYYETYKANYGDYGRTLTDEKPVGFVKVFVSRWGKIYGAVIVGDAAGEIIHEFILAIHKKMSLHEILFIQHSFPTISLLNKRVAENWMMAKFNNSGFLRKIAQFMFRLF